jgi:hypothetical protein
MRIARPAAALSLLAICLACHNEGDTIINNSDCGVVRTDLEGTWNFSFPAGSTQLFNCSNPVYNNKDVILSSNLNSSYNDIDVFASAGNVGFFFHDSATPEEVYGNVEVSSCGMLFAFRITASSTDSTPLYLQCIGTLDRSGGFVGASCDSATVLASPLTDPVVVVADCDLSLLIQASVTIQ